MQATDHAPDADGWVLLRARADACMPRDTALFALANGTLGVCFGEEESGAASASFLAAAYERHAIRYHERLPGFADHTDTRVPVADGSGVALWLDGERIDFATCARLDTSCALDLRAGRTQRRTTWRTPAGATLRIHAERVVAPDRDVLAIRYRVESIDFDGELRIESSLRPGAIGARQGDDPRIGAGNGAGLLTLSADARDGIALLQQHARHSGVVVWAALAHRLRDGDALQRDAVDVQDERVDVRFRAALAAGSAATLETFVAYSVADANAETNHAAASQRARTLAGEAAASGFDALARQRADELDGFWRDVQLDLDGADDSALALRLNLFHVLQSCARNAHSGTAAKGLTGEGYEGHCFWDTEAFVLPVMAFTAPAKARAMLGWRYRLLDAARANARQMNHDTGALYPWRTIAGRECSAHYPSGSAAYHINAAIAYGIGVYVDATADDAFLIEMGAEMLFETARIWMQAGHFDPLDDGRFGIHGVTGPDEYTALVDNNFHTNRMAQQHLLRAAATWDALSAGHAPQLQALAARIGLDEREIDDWRRAAAAMRLQVDPTLGIYAQDDTFLHKPRWDFAAHADGKPLLLDCHPLTLYRHQVCKQADVVMALVLAGDGLDPEVVHRSFDYYEAITTHDSTLSAAIHGILAARLGLTGKALDYFAQALRVDLDDLHHNTHHGVHMAAMAGSWLGLACGFGGLRIAGGALWLAPTLPDGWSGYRFGLRWRGRRVVVSVDGDGVRYRLVDGEPMSLHHGDDLLILERGTVVARALSPPPPGAAVFPRAARALVFDLDGVLTDTASLHYRAWKRLADEIGVAFDDVVNRRLKGVDRARSLDIVLERATRVYNAEEKLALAARKDAYYRASIDGFGPQNLFPGARALLQAARDAGLRIALASASRNAPALLSWLGIEDAFDAVVDPASLARQKPAPDIFLAAASALGVAAAECIGIEDAAAGIDAIHAAGMAAIGIGTREELPQADAVVPHIGALRLADFVTPRVSGVAGPASDNAQATRPGGLP